MTKRRANPAAPWSIEKSERRLLASDENWADDWIAKTRAACHPKQLAFVDDPALLVSAVTSRGAGKSTGAMARLLITMGRRKKAPCLFIAQTREQATEILWTHLKDVVEKLMIDATWSEVRRTCTFPNGSTLRLVGADDRKEIDKLRGQAFAGVVIDEAASHGAALLANLIERVIEPRLGEHDGWIALTGTPGHELRGTFYDATRPKGPLHRPYADRDLPEWHDKAFEWSSHRWTLEDGAPYVAAMRKLWERALINKDIRGWSDTHPIWLREYRATWAADDTDHVFKYRPHNDAGDEWNVWNPERDDFGLAKLPEGRTDWLTVVIFDRGFSDPFAVNAFSFSPSDPTRTIYHRYCYESTGVYARKLADLFLGEGHRTDKPAGLFGAIGEWPVAVAGDTDEALVAELANVYGVRAAVVIKRRDYKFGAVELTNGDFAEGRIKVLAGSPLESQLLELQWVADEYGQLHENKAQPNHSTDCLIYGRRIIAQLFDTGQIPDEKKASKRKQREERQEEPSPQEDWSGLLASGSYDDEPW